MRSHPSPRMDLPVSLALYQQLLSASAGTGFQKEHWEIAAEAIDEWMRRHSPDAIPMPATNGYQWKRLFLPNGTLLRTVFGGKNHHCMVEGDQILFNRQAISPSGFVNAVGGIRRNAWRCTWILFPDTKEWKLADTLRTRERPHHERKPMVAFRQATVTQSSVARAPAHIPPTADPTPAQAEPFATGVSEEPGPQAPRGDKIQGPDSNDDHRSRHGQIRRGPERRTGGADAMSRSLREELLRFLYPTSAFDEQRRKTHAWPNAPTGAHRLAAMAELRRSGEC